MDVARKTALDILIAWEREGAYPDRLLRDKLEGMTDKKDRAFCTGLVYGVVQNKLKLDYWIAKKSTVALRKIHIVTRNALRLGLYQGIFMNVPVSAACNTSVELVKKNGQFKSSGFVNAILRNLLADPCMCTLPEEKTAQALSIRVSVSLSVVELLVNQYGYDFTETYLEAVADSKATESYLAVNTVKVTDEQLIKCLSDEGVTAIKAETGLLSACFSGNLTALKAYKDGLFHIIGKPSFITAKKLDAGPQEKVLDLCSAPGGKTFVMAYNMNNTGKIVACDVHPTKVDELEKQANRLRITNTEFVCLDATHYNPTWEGAFDKVLCDVPCSGLGILGKKPDIRYKDMSSFSLTETQKKILANGLRYLKKDGKLVYSTCTVSKTENEQIVCQSGAKVLAEKTFLPQVDGTEGFYCALLLK